MPTLLIHDHILVNKYEFGIRLPFSKTWLTKPTIPKRGDIVVFRSVESDTFFLIKRVIGLPVDEISYDEKGQLFINGKPIPRHLMKDPNHWMNDDFYRASAVDVESNLNDLKFYDESLGSKDVRTILRNQDYRTEQAPLKIPPDHLFLMGDNRDNSRDSRFWGLLPTKNLLGRAMFVWLSCTQTFESAPFLCNPLTVRWKRFFHSIQ